VIDQSFEGPNMAPTRPQQLMSRVPGFRREQLHNTEKLRRGPDPPWDASDGVADGESDSSMAGCDFDRFDVPFGPWTVCHHRHFGRPSNFSPLPAFCCPSHTGETGNQESGTTDSFAGSPGNQLHCGSVGTRAHCSTEKRILDASGCPGEIYGPSMARCLLNLTSMHRTIACAE
jgi:hypothetical protein